MQDPSEEERPEARPTGADGTPPVVLEIVAQSVRDARAAEAGGADRIELCTALVDGGLTPPESLVEAVVDAVNLPVFVLVRPRGGDFVLDDDDVELMRVDVRRARDTGAAGIVVGALTPEGDVDVARLARLVAAASPLPVTFHRAFDHARDPLEALARVRSLGIARILTSGQAADAPAGVDLLAALAEASGGRPRIVAGGGVRPENVAALVRRTGIRELHGSARGPRPSPARHVNDAVPLGPSQAALRVGVEVTQVRALREAAESVPLDG